MITVIGGSGFIGTRLCSRLETTDPNGFCILDKVQSRSFPAASRTADVRSVDSILAGLEDEAIIINLAAEHRDDVRPRSLYDDVNVRGAENVCDAARARGVKTIVFTSSVAVYGFAPVGTSESGAIAPFNDYGRTKHAAEDVYRAWQAEAPTERTLAIVRPTVVFGERNRGNVFNLLRQIASGRFVMVGDGKNRKSMAYVENVAAFLEFCVGFAPGVHVYNYIDKPDFTMSALVAKVSSVLGKSPVVKFRLPYAVGFAVGLVFDVLARITGSKFPISSIRIKKFCADSVFDSSASNIGFRAPVPLEEGLCNTIRCEFIEAQPSAELFHSE